MRGNDFEVNKVVPLIFKQFWSRSDLNKLDWLTPQDVYYIVYLLYTRYYILNKQWRVKSMIAQWGWIIFEYEFQWHFYNFLPIKALLFLYQSLQFDIIDFLLVCDVLVLFLLVQQCFSWLVKFCQSHIMLQLFLI